MAETNILNENNFKNKKEGVNNMSEKKECCEKTNTCEAEVLETKTLSECESCDHQPEGKYGPLVAKIPVVLSEPEIQISVESLIKLEEKALEVKRIKKNLFITQCKLLPKACKLFLSGYVRKNIEYATVKCVEDNTVSGDIKHTTVNIPFDCVTAIKFKSDVCFKDRDATKEFDFINVSTNPCMKACKDTVIGKDPCEKDSEDHETFNEKVFCELVEAKIFEEDIHENPEKLCQDKSNEYTFDKVKEKMVIIVKLKLLQLQQVCIPKSYKKED